MPRKETAEFTAEIVLHRWVDRTLLAFGLHGVGLRIRSIRHASIHAQRSRPEAADDDDDDHSDGDEGEQHGAAAGLHADSSSLTRIFGAVDTSDEADDLQAVIMLDVLSVGLAPPVCPQDCVVRLSGFGHFERWSSLSCELRGKDPLRTLWSPSPPPAPPKRSSLAASLEMYDATDDDYDGETNGAAEMLYAGHTLAQLSGISSGPTHSDAANPVADPPGPPMPVPSPPSPPSLPLLRPPPPSRLMAAAQRGRQEELSGAAGGIAGASSPSLTVGLMALLAVVGLGGLVGFAARRRASASHRHQLLPCSQPDASEAAVAADDDEALRDAAEQRARGARRATRKAKRRPPADAPRLAPSVGGRTRSRAVDELLAVQERERLAMSARFGAVS